MLKIHIHLVINMSFTCTKSIIVQHSSFTERLKILRFDFTPWYVSNPYFNIPILLIFRFNSFVQGPCNLKHKFSKSIKTSIQQISYIKR